MHDLVVHLTEVAASEGVRMTVSHLNKMLEEQGLSTETVELSGFAFLKWVRAHRKKIAYVHIHGAVTVRKNALICRLLRLPYAVSVDGDVQRGGRGLQKALRRARAVFFSSEGQQQQVLQKLKLSHAHVVYTPVDVAEGDMPPKSFDTINLVMMSDLREEYNIDELLWIIGKLHLEDNEKIKVDVFPRGDDGSGYEEKLKNTNYPGLTLHGAQADKSNIFKAAHLLMVLSQHDKERDAVVEAMAFQVPPICYQVGVFPEIIVHGITGILCKTREEILNVIRALAIEPRGLDALGRMAHKSYKKSFSISAFETSMITALKELLPPHE